MENYNLEREDYIQIEKLFKTTSSISELYTRLYKLELDNKAFSDEYNKTLDYLRISVEVEKKIYEDANLDSSKCRKWYNYIQFRELYVDKNFGIEAVLQQDYRNPEAKRIIATLATIVGEKDHIWNVTDGYFEGIQQVDIIKEIRNDIFSIFETIIALDKNEKQDKQVRDDFLIAKYYTSFMFKTYEEHLLENDFKIPKVPTTNSRFFIDLTKFDPTIYKSLNQKYPFGLFNDQYKKVLYLNYDSLDEVSSSFLLRLKFMIAILIQIDNETFNMLNYTFFSELNHSTTIDTNIVEQLILHAFEEVRKERRNKKIIRLGNNKIYKK